MDADPAPPALAGAIAIEPNQPLGAEVVGQLPHQMARFTPGQGVPDGTWLGQWLCRVNGWTVPHW